VHSLAKRVLSHIRRQEFLRAGDRVGVAVSGGIDSVALLRLLLELRGELGIVVSVVHFNHRLRGAESDADERFMANLAREHGLEFFVDSEDVGAHATEERVSIETAARELRYGFFRHLLGEGAPQGLKPDSFDTPHRGAEAPLFHGTPDGATGSRAPSNPAPANSVIERSGESGGEYPPLPQRTRQGWGTLGSFSSSDQPRRGWLDKIVTGHTLDDQAETVLMRMIRGAGMRGLGGIHTRIAVEDENGDACGEIARPLLGIRRRELEQYLKDIGQSWREDSSNADDAYTRNRVRRLLVPLLEKEFNPAVAENLAELAEIARDEEDFWENEVAGWMGTGVHWSEPEWAKEPPGSGLVQIGAAIDHQAGIPTKATPQGLKPPFLSPPIGTFRSLRSVRAGSKSEAVPFPELPFPEHGPPANAKVGASLSGNSRLGDSSLQSRINAAPWLVANASVDRRWFLGEPAAAQRRLIKAIGERAGIPLEFKHVEEIRRCAEDDESGKELSLPLGWKMVRESDELIFVTPDLREGPLHIDEYEYDIPVPGRIFLPETNSFFEVLSVPASEASGYNPDQLLDAQSLLRPLRMRNWRPGDRFWPAHSKSPKKIKELLQERHAAHEQRKLWPVVVSGDDNEIVWMRGFPTPAKFHPQPGRDAVLIVEKTLESQPSK
jgi:tRNA(Ile)-lysidine synthetase-like protein